MNISTVIKTLPGDRLQRPVLPAHGNPSPRFGHYGMWNYCLGPNSPIPGTRLIILILDERGNIMRRLEQIRGECIDAGYVDFFMSHNCRPATHEYPVVDIDATGHIVSVIHPNYTPSMGMGPYLEFLEAWVKQYGNTAWGFTPTS